MDGGDFPASFDPWYPLARHEDLVQSAVDDGVIVYDQRSNHIHTLNHACQAVWLSCDGTRSVTAVKQAAEGRLGADLLDEVVLFALRELAKAGLLTNPVPAQLDGNVSTRRTLLRRLGAATAMPLLVSVSAPAAAQASSGCLPDWEFCNTSDECCGGLCYDDRHCSWVGCKEFRAPCVLDGECCSGGCLFPGFCTE